MTGELVTMAAGLVPTSVRHRSWPVRRSTATTNAPWPRVVMVALVSPSTSSFPNTAGLVRERSPVIPV